MTFTKSILTLSFLILGVVPSITFGQKNCDTLKIYNTEFDSQFQEAYQSLQSDTIIALTHCGSTNGCYNQIGLLAWKSNGKLTIRKYIGQGTRITSNTKVSRLTRDLIDQFFLDKIYRMNSEISSQYYIDDGPATLVVFKTSDSCWTYNHELTSSEDKRVKWTEELIWELKK